MPPTEHSRDKLPAQSTTTTAFGDSEVQHVATSATQDVFSETVGDDDKLVDVPPAIPGTVGEMRDTTSSTVPTTIPGSAGAVQERNVVCSALRFRSRLSTGLRLLSWLKNVVVQETSQEYRVEHVKVSFGSRFLT